MILFNSAGKILDNISNHKENFVWIIANEDINLQITSNNESSIVSFDPDVEYWKPIYLKSQTAKMFTIYIDTNENVCEFTANGIPYKFIYNNPNIIPEHYTTLINNANLPTNDEILACIVDKDKYMILGKLLLSYKDILRHKGKKLALTKFLTFIGFDSIEIFEEWKNVKTGKLSLLKEEDSEKTGNYYLIINQDYWNRLDENNLPKLIREDNVDNFLEIFFNAIDVAHKYFLIPEQDIKFIGLHFQTNVRKNLSVGSNFTALYHIDPFAFLKGVNMNVWIENEFTETFIIKNSKINIDTIEPRVVENVFNLARWNPETPNNDIFSETAPFVLNKKIAVIANSPFYPAEELFRYLETRFGVILNINTEMHPIGFPYSRKFQLEIINKDDLSVHFLSEYELVSYYKFCKIFIGTPGRYKMIFRFLTEHNNREEFYYNFEVTQTSTLIKHKSFNSTELSAPTTNNLSMQIDDFTNYIIDGNKKYYESPFDMRFKIKDVTDMPIKFIDNFLDVTAYEMNDNTLSIDDIKNVQTQDFLDKHFLYLLDIEGEMNKFLFVANRDTGINNDEINMNNWMTKYSQQKIPVNVNFDLPDENTEYQSLYKYITINDNTLKLNDIFVMELDKILGFYDFEWEIVDTYFDTRVYYQQGGRTLKYRVKRKGKFDVKIIGTSNFGFRLNLRIKNAFKSI